MSTPWSYIGGKGKEKVNFTLEQTTKAQGVIEILLNSFFNLGAKMEWVVNATTRPLYPRESEPIPNVQEDRWAPGPVWMGVENLAPPGFGPRTVQPIANRYTDWLTAI
jgi:hypothetical protein